MERWESAISLGDVYPWISLTSASKRFRLKYEGAPTFRANQGEPVDRIEVFEPVTHPLKPPFQQKQAPGIGQTVRQKSVESLEGPAAGRVQARLSRVVQRRDWQPFRDDLCRPFELSKAPGHRQPADRTRRGSLIGQQPNR